VADISYNPRTNQYRIALVEPYRSELPHTRNFLLLDVADFTVDNLLAAFERNVLLVYERKCEAVRDTLLRARRTLTSAHNGQ